ncbi:MAG: transpeptidase family protein [Archangiaceae bacterium]|nr:transpeptidase family protein [Archangiaceae bacterium]
MRDLKRTAAARVDDPTRWVRLRVSMVGVVFLGLLAAVFARAVQLQVRERERLRGMAQDQYVRDVEIPARRGDIFDRRGVALAQSVDVDSIWVDPSQLLDVKLASYELAKKLDVDRAELYDRMQRAKRFAWVKRQARPEDVAAAKALGWPMLGIMREPRRFYPQRELAAHVIGLVGTDGHGLDGLELAFEDELSGDPTTRLGFRDARGRKLLTNGLEDVTARQGAAVTLTLDRQLQYVTERALESAVDGAKAVAGMAVVMDPKTGEILALANAPRFNPNAPEKSAPGALRNRSVTDAFEPGSTFKAFVVAAALDAHAITESSTFDCEKGAWAIGKHVVHDTHPHDVLTPGKILQVSSNIGAAKIGAALGREKLVDAFSRFGFAEKPDLGLPGAARGSIPFPRAEISLATQSYGQGLTASAIQLAAGYAALANGGTYMKPYLVSKVVDPDGVVLLENRPTAERRAVSEKAAKAVISMLESVVEKDGTAPKARMDEFRVAGKTGTAQKVDTVAKGYSDKRIASFIGVVPAENPRAVIVVIVDEPKTDIYGGLVAAPAFKEIATAAMPYLGAQPSRAPSAAPATVASAEKPAPRPKEPAAKNPVVAAIEALDTVTEPIAAGVVRVPDLKGKVSRQAVAMLLGASLEPRLDGSGRVTSQAPAPGSLVDRGTRVTLHLAGNAP